MFFFSFPRSSPLNLVLLHLIGKTPAKTIVLNRQIPPQDWFFAENGEITEDRERIAKCVNLRKLSELPNAAVKGHFVVCRFYIANFP